MLWRGLEWIQRKKPFHYTAIFGKNLYANVQVATRFYNLYIFFVGSVKIEALFLCRILLFNLMHLYKSILIIVVRNEPQATAVKLAQLGGGRLLRGTSCPP
nr:MAG TPA: hypothetical protein [Caudoviricetes sp.]